MSKYNELLELVDSKIDKVQYAVQNGVPYTDSLSDLQEIRTAIMVLEIDDEHNNQSHDSPEHGDQDATAKGESS